jgi:hypothetical protein
MASNSEQSSQEQFLSDHIQVNISYVIEKEKKIENFSILIIFLDK